MAIRLRFGTGVGFSTLGAQLMERRDARRAARRARREAMEFQAEQAEIARETAAEQAAAGREAQAAAATQQQAAAFQRTALQVAGAGARQQVGIGAAQEAAEQGQEFKRSQAMLDSYLKRDVLSPTQLSRATKLMADRAGLPRDRTQTPQEQATARQIIDAELKQIFENPAGELKKKEPTFEQQSRQQMYYHKDLKAFVYPGPKGEIKIHEPKAEIAAEARAEAVRVKELGELRKQLYKLEGDKREFIKKFDSILVKGRRVYAHKEVRRMAAAEFNKYITAKEAEIFAAEEDFGQAEPGEEFFGESTPLERGVGRAGVPEPTEAPTPSPFLTPEAGGPEGAVPPPQALPPEPQAALGVQAAGARIPQTPQEIKGSPQHAIQAFRQLTPELVQTLPPDAQRAFQLVQQRMETFMAEPGRAKVFGLQDMPFELRAMIAAIVAHAQGETNVRRPAIAQ